MDPDMLAKAIVEHYYSTFDTNQSSLANLHQEGSMLTFEGQKIQGVSSICHHSISTINCQPSGINVSMLVFVSGNLQLVGEQHILKFNEAATSVNFSLAQLIQVIILLCTSGKNGGGYEASKYETKNTNLQTEETKGADRNRPKGIASEVGIFIIVGWGYILGISFAVTNIPYFLRESNDAGRYAIGEMFYLAF
ncbi:hypothetical protein JHK85_035767 [Glycine max]|nr:hypothetical protein JHK85_035767 [Glycine max]KAG4975658.1 hypothetical protein JHK86_035132 [Glycine max]